jgi:hypothetical protein
MREEIPLIPFFGGQGVPPSTQPSQVADWIQEQDKVPLLLALSLYNTPLDNLQNFQLIPNTNKTRSAAWFNTQTGQTIIGLRGTSLFSKYGSQDIQDDRVNLIMLIVGGRPNRLVF